MNYKKIFLAIAIFLFVFSAPSVGAMTAVKTMTSAEIQALIRQLQAQIVQLQQQLVGASEQPAVWCYDFNKNLKYGDMGSQVEALQTALEKEGLYEKKGNASNFDEYLASAVVGFQEKYASEILSSWGLKHGTGFVGNTTRIKLNKIYGCGAIMPPLPPITIPTPITPVIPIPEPPITPATTTSSTDCQYEPHANGGPWLIQSEGYWLDMDIATPAVKTAKTPQAYSGIENSLTVGPGQKVTIKAIVDFKGYTACPYCVMYQRVFASWDTSKVLADLYTGQLPAGLEYKEKNITFTAPTEPGEYKLHLNWRADYVPPPQYCDNNIVETTLIVEETTTTTTPTCTDTDGGKNYYSKGIVKLVNGLSDSDFCRTNSILAEFSCSTGYSGWDVHNYTCPHGCENGSCVKEEVEVNIVGGGTFSAETGKTAVINKFSLSNRSSKESAEILYFVIGNESANNFINYFERDSYELIEVSNTGIQTKVSDLKNTKIGDRPTDYLIFDLIHTIKIAPSATKSYLIEAKTKSEVSGNFTTAHLTKVKGLTGSSRGPITSSGQAKGDVNIISAAIPTCTDTDGGIDYYVRGKITGEDLSGNPREWWDNCNILSSDGGTTNVLSCTGKNCILEEYYCGTRQDGTAFINGKEYTCPYGCEKGACVKEGKFITILSPNGGETLREGEDYTIQWRSNDLSPTAKVTFYMHRDDGLNGYILKDEYIPASWEKYSWKVETELDNWGHGYGPTGKTYATIISDSDTTHKYKLFIRADGVSDFSDDYFTIIKASAPDLTIGEEINVLENGFKFTVCNKGNEDLFTEKDIEAKIRVSVPWKTETIPSVTKFIAAMPAELKVNECKETGIIPYSEFNMKRGTYYAVTIWLDPNNDIDEIVEGAGRCYHPTVPQVTTSKPLSCGSYGDINSDGYITEEDINLLFALIGNSATTEQQTIGDINGNGSLDFDDPVKLNSYLNGTIDALPVCGKKPLSCGSYGDINSDGYITEEDINLLFSLIGNSATTEQQTIGDINGNGSLDFDDPVKLNSYLNGTIDALPVCGS